MSGDALAKALFDLIAVKVGEKYHLSGLPNVALYGDAVPKSPTYPYILFVTNFPSVSERSLARSASARALRSRATVVGLSTSSVRIIAQKLSDVLEGKRPTVTGWNLGAIESVPNEQPIYHDRDVILPGTSDSPFYQTFDWILTGSPTT